MKKIERKAKTESETGYVHKSVLLQEMIDGLDIQDGDTIVDCTLNSGGHSELVLERFPKATIIGIDADSLALKRATERLKRFDGRWSAYESNFRHLDKVLEKAGKKEVEGFMFDLGLSSDQLETSGRGFTFQKDEPLQMTFASPETNDPEVLTAREIVNDWAEESIIAILEGYGEESFAKRIAEAIVRERETKPIETTAELEKIIYTAVPSFYRHKKTHPATKTFQAIRIAVNDEYGALKDGLEKAFNHLKQGKSMAVISFHSGEDRIVKVWMKEKAGEEKATLKTKKPIVASDEELKVNPRARSAKLRLLTKI